MPRPARVSPDQILAAAAREFAARGYAGAGVDRIAKRARVNKAMLYYHFGSKRGLYRRLLRDTFSEVAGRLERISSSPATAAEQLDRVVATFAEYIAEHPSFPAIMMREVAEGGVHLDRETLAALSALPLAVGRIVRHGVEQRELRPIHPLAAYFTLFAPIAMFLGGTPIRKRLGAERLVPTESLSGDMFVQHIQQCVRLAFAAPPSAGKKR
jgi:AcrR family transcriptional regulator